MLLWAYFCPKCTMGTPTTPGNDLPLSASVQSVVQVEPDLLDTTQGEGNSNGNDNDKDKDDSNDEDEDNSDDKDKDDSNSNDEDNGNGNNGDDDDGNNNIDGNSDNDNNGNDGNDSDDEEAVPTHGISPSGIAKRKWCSAAIENAIPRLKHCRLEIPARTRLQGWKNDLFFARTDALMKIERMLNAKKSPFHSGRNGQQARRARAIHSYLHMLAQNNR